MWKTRDAAENEVKLVTIRSTMEGGNTPSYSGRVDYAL